jgi:hypothetical protein
MSPGSREKRRSLYVMQHGKFHAVSGSEPPNPDETSLDVDVTNKHDQVADTIQNRSFIPERPV